MAESWDLSRLDHRERQTASIAASALSLLTEHGGPGLTMAAVADRAGIARQTLYRYFKDVDAVLIGIAELVTSHDEALAQLIAEQSDPRSQLELLAKTATGDGHSDQNVSTLMAVLPPAGRDIVAQHHRRACDLLAGILQNGIDQGVFRPDLNPQTDAPLMIGLLGAADSNAPDRAISLVFQLAEPEPEEPGK